jgi:hypothetical protein
VERSRVEVALVYTDGRKVIADISRPSALVWFGDTFEKLQPETYSEIARLVHHVEAPEQPFDEWLADVEILDAQEETVQEVRAALASENGRPTSPAPEPSQVPVRAGTTGDGT